MVKKEISKLTYGILTTILYALCSAGLLWQVTQISLNYFKFEVVSDIKIMLPESDKQNKSFNFCFYSGEVCNLTMFDNIASQYSEYFHGIDIDDKSNRVLLIRNNFTIKERFDITIAPNEIFPLKNGANVSMFISFEEWRKCFNVCDWITQLLSNRRFEANSSICYGSKLPRQSIVCFHICDFTLPKH